MQREHEVKSRPFCKCRGESLLRLVSLLWRHNHLYSISCLLYTSDAADEEDWGIGRNMIVRGLEELTAQGLATTEENVIMWCTEDAVEPRLDTEERAVQEKLMVQAVLKQLLEEQTLIEEREPSFLGGPELRSLRLCE